VLTQALSLRGDAALQVDGRLHVRRTLSLIRLRTILAHIRNCGVWDETGDFAPVGRPSWLCSVLLQRVVSS
jgi:hypothetical protein